MSSIRTSWNRCVPNNRAAAVNMRSARCGVFVRTETFTPGREPEPAAKREPETGPASSIIDRRSGARKPKSPAPVRSLLAPQLIDLQHELVEPALQRQQSARLLGVGGPSPVPADLEARCGPG